MFFLYVDQAEELYVRGERQHPRFSKLLAEATTDPRLVTLMSMRSDFLGHLQNDEPLFAVHRKIDVPPLRETELSRVITEPAQQLSARFESQELVAVITRRTLEDSAKDVGALPLLSYTLDDMWGGWCAVVTACCGCPRRPSNSEEFWPSAQMLFWRAIPTPRMRYVVCSPTASRLYERKAVRRGVVRRAQSFQAMSGGL
jgi:hypothetical protein